MNKNLNSRNNEPIKRKGLLIYFFLSFCMERKIYKKNETKNKTNNNETARKR
jgi:hypothetical protein